MADVLPEPSPDPRRALEWLPPEGSWRELWFTQDAVVGAVPEEPVLADLEAAIAAGWAEGGEMVFGFNDDDLAPGARTMRAYRMTPAGGVLRPGRGGGRTGVVGTGVSVGR